MGKVQDKKDSACTHTAEADMHKDMSTLHTGGKSKLRRERRGKGKRKEEGE